MQKKIVLQDSLILHDSYVIMQCLNTLMSKDSVIGIYKNKDVESSLLVKNLEEQVNVLNIQFEEQGKQLKNYKMAAYIVGALSLILIIK